MYKYRKMKEKAILTEYLGDETIVNIPTEIDGLIVSRISSMCFFGNDSVEEIHFPKDVSIDNNAIVDCPNLKSVFISSVNRIGNIMEDCEQASIVSEDTSTINKMFKKNIEKSMVVNLSIFETAENEDGTLNILKIRLPKNSQDMEITIPDFINGKKVVGLAEKCCLRIFAKSITLNKFIEVIPNNCFNGAIVGKLLNVGNIKKVNEYAFYNSEISVIDTFSDLRIVERYAFYQHRGHLSIGDKLSKVSDYSFGGSEITSLYLGELTSELPEGLVQNCGKLKVFEFPKKTTTIPKNFFSYCQNLEELTNTKYITRLESRCLYNCNNLDTSCFKFNKITFMGNGALFGVTLPSTLRIGDCEFDNGALQGTLGITRIVFTNDYKKDEVPENFCRDVKGLKSVVLNENIKKIKNNAFYCCSVASINLENVEEIEPYAFNRSGLKHVKLVKIMKLDNSCFMGTHNLISMDLSESKLTQLPSSFLSGSNVSKVTLPSTLEIIEANAFWNTKISKLELNEGLKVLGPNFISESKIKQLTLPKSLEKVKGNAFYRLKAELTFLGNNVSFEKEAFCGITCKVLDLSNMNMPVVFEKMFANANIDNLLLPKTITEIRPEGFNSAKIKNLKMDYDSIETVGHRAFFYSHINNLEVASKAKYFRDYCYFRTNLCTKDIVLYNPLDIGEGAFAKIDGIENVTILGNTDVSRGNFEIKGLKSIKSNQGKVLTRLKSRVFFKTFYVSFEKIKTK